MQDGTQILEHWGKGVWLGPEGQGRPHIDARSGSWW